MDDVTGVESDTYKLERTRQIKSQLQNPNIKGVQVLSSSIQ